MFKAVPEARGCSMSMIKISERSKRYSEHTTMPSTRPFERGDIGFCRLKAMVLNLFAEGSQIQTYEFIREPH